MEEFNGYLSLLFASIEIVLLINILIFSEKNRTNKVAFLLFGFLFGYQLVESLLCAVGIDSNILLAIGLADISFLPPLGLILTFRFLKINFKWEKLLFIPPIFFTIYYLINSSAMRLLQCTPFVAGYTYPLGFLYGLFYYVPILITLYLLFLHYGKQSPKKKKIMLPLLLGFGLTFIPYSIIYPFIQGSRIFFESILCKIAFILALFIAYFTLQNREKK